MGTGRCWNCAGKLLVVNEPESSAAGPIASVTTEALAASVARLLPEGLPADEAAAGMLLDLRSVYARAVVPREPRSRLAALNQLVPRLIATIADANYRNAVQTMFGLAPGSRGTLLTARRRQAAEILGYSSSHLRSEIEPKLVLAVANLLHDDLLRYEPRVRRTAESLEPTGDTPTLGPEHLTHEEELISRIWQHVYGLRAELIAHARLSEADGQEANAEDHRQAALCEQERLQALLKEYVDTYGRELIHHGEAEFSVEGLERLAGWRW